VKRAPAVLAATAAGLAATLGFHPHSRATTVAATPATTSTTRASSGAKTVTSEAVSTQYGPVQLQVTIKGGKITDIQAVQLPSQDPKDVEINNYAAPILRQSALSAQSANIDVVSGATYTSEGYMQALQSALDSAGFQTSSSATG
jgi:uncharacterized protein with FMN-binding domain